jgi:hypothetical protein
MNILLLLEKRIILMNLVYKKEEQDAHPSITTFIGT